MRFVSVLWIALGIFSASACSIQETTPAVSSTPEVVQPVPHQISDEDAAKTGFVRYYEVMNSIGSQGGLSPEEEIPESLQDVTMGEEQEAALEEFRRQRDNGVTTIGGVKLTSLTRVDANSPRSLAGSIVLQACADGSELRYQPGDISPQQPFAKTMAEMLKDTDGQWKVAILRSEFVDAC